MFSNEQCHKLNASDDFSLELMGTKFLEKFASDINSCGAILIEYDKDAHDQVGSDIDIISSCGIDVATFKGSQKNVLREFLKECYTRYPSPHSHNMSKSELWRSLSKVCNTIDWCQSVIYYPLQARGYNLILLLFYSKGFEVKITDALVHDVDEFMDILTYFMLSVDIQDRYNTIQVYVKEIGHDIASSVQAILAKLRMVSRGKIVGERAMKKIEEAEEEIMATYRIADTLGITVDPKYNLKSETLFVFSDIIESAIRLCRSEAKERHIEIKYEPMSQIRGVEIVGDDKALQLALIQLIMNAIKYARGSTDIQITLNDLDYSVECSVINVGYGIDEKDYSKLWEFGYRGDAAKEMHVNGSGIGLFTVKKIINAHSGSVGLQLSGISNKRARFYFRVPKTSLNVK